MYDRDNYRGSIRQGTGDAVWTMGKTIGVVVLFIVIIGVLGFLTRGFGLMQEKVFAPAEEQVRHDVFKESQSYNDGMIQELENMYLDYQKAEPEHKAALRSVILHRYAHYDEGRLPAHLKSFIRQLKNEAR